MTGKEALENISIEFDEYGFVPTTTTTRKDKHFTEWWKKEYEIINEELERSEKLERAFEIFTKDKELTLHKGKCPISGTDEYKLSFVNWKSLTKEEYELIEELIKNENS